MACIHLANFNLAVAPTIWRSQQPNIPNMKLSKLVCRAQNKPVSDSNGDGEVQSGGVNRRLVIDSLVVASAAVGSALASFVSPAYGNGSESSEEFSLYPPGIGI